MSARTDTLTARESAVLAAIERRLSNPEIAAELFISVRTVESHIASLKRKLGAESRAELMAAAAERRERAASVRLPRNAFVGRDADLATLADLLDEQRWVTVVGPGGVGKTRLALEFASRSEHVPVIVELEHAEPGDVVARIARALDLEAVPGADAATSVVMALASHPYLLVLDNVDRVGPAVGELVARAQARANGLRVLTTSRTPIGDDLEAVYPLAPLPVGGTDAPAVTMFLDRLGASGGAAAARLSTADLELAAHVCERLDGLPLAAHVCERLDGLPLAIELAAAVARHLSLAELAERLDRDFATLDRAVPAGRHRTLETAFDWTWDLLTEEERDVLCRLAALPRTFDIDLASAVTHPGAEGTVLRLLDHSLLVATGGSPRRFRLLAVMREFVHARTDPAVIREVLEQHAVYMQRITDQFVVTARTDDSARALDLSATLCPEVNAALRWALAAKHPSALPLAADLSIGVEQYGSDVDSVRAIAMAARDERVLASATPQQLLLMGNALAFLDVELVGELAQRAMALAGGDGDDRARLAAHHLAGMADAYADRDDTAHEHLDEAERIASSLGDSWELAAVHQMRGIAFRHATPPQTERAMDEFEAAMRGFALAGDAMHVNNARFMLAFAAADSGRELDRAEQLVSECIAYAHSVGNEHELAHAYLVRAKLHRDDPTEGDNIAALIGTFRRLGDLRCLSRSLALQARRVPSEARVGLLEEALSVAEAGGNRDLQSSTLTALVDARWALGDRVATLATLDRLAAIAGADAASAACPPELVDDFTIAPVN
ncbi:LuxR C-terminal-related transcriptional regulator [Agromyces sp. Marseille-P2726]|uniref:ATP-binding protein n=1 Tax=Agromyces sp. Marseille-P2726 TaxID=2709132 RepID=UPI00156F57B3|nr:LuxR C-terminal-related transcriptional regulator [Agromyces sp. Marseille-P2726]